MAKKSKKGRNVIWSSNGGWSESPPSPVQLKPAPQPSRVLSGSSPAPTFEKNLAKVPAWCHTDAYKLYGLNCDPGTADRAAAEIARRGGRSLIHDDGDECLVVADVAFPITLGGNHVVVPPPLLRLSAWNAIGRLSGKLREEDVTISSGWTLDDVLKMHADFVMP